MSRTSLHKSLKQVLHGNEGVSGAQPNLSRSDVLIAVKDTCINRENPNRNIAAQSKLIVGFDAEGTYDNLIKSGYTQGFWTMPPLLTPAVSVDSAGARNQYLSRSLLEFNLRDSDAYTSRSVNHAVLSLTFASHKNLARVEGITLGLHSFYCAASQTGGAVSGGTTQGDTNHWAGTSTWYEYRYTGACEMVSGVGGGLSGGDDPDSGGGNIQGQGGKVGTDIGIKVPGFDKVGFTGAIWNMQGLGATGGMAQDFAQSSGVDPGVVASGNFLDFSQGASFGGHYEATLTNSVGIGGDNNFNMYPQVYLTNKDITANSRLEIDITKAVKAAYNLQQGILRIMICVEGDYVYNRGFAGVRAKERAWVGFHSRETRNEPLLLTSTQNSKVTNQDRPRFAPHIVINYD